MASSRQPDLTALDAAIVRFVDDFQSIIRAEVERTVRRALGGQAAPATRTPRKAAVEVPKRAAPLKKARAARRAVASAVKSKASPANTKPERGKRRAQPASEPAAKPRRKRPEQLSLF